MQQINIIAQNRVGALDEILLLLASNDINVEAVEVESSQQQGVVSLVVDRYEDAFKLLTIEGYQAVAEDVLVLVIEDRPGALGRVSHALAEANINIRSVRILSRQQGLTTVGLVTEDNAASRAVLGDVVVPAA